MIFFRRYLSGFLLMIAVMLTACSTTKIKSVWKEPSYLGQPQRVMVVAVAKEPINRRIFEDEFVLQFKARGTDAIASYTVLPDSSQNDQAAIAKLVEQMKADTVLISRLVSKRSVRVYYPATVTYRPRHYLQWQDYYRHGYDTIDTQGYMTQYEYALMETNLYDARNDNLLWATTTETGVNNFNQILIKPYIGTIMNMMAGHGVLRK